MITITPVSDKKLLAQFVDFPHQLYSDDKNYVPELFIAQRDLLTPGKHPFHENADIQLFLAFQGSEIKGRIAAIVNHNHNNFNKVNDGFFGFFDCVNDDNIAKALFETAENWVKAKAATKIIGPVNPSTNEAIATLIDGFDTPPRIMMPYNKPYYKSLIEAAGYSKQVDLFAFDLKTATVNDKATKVKDVLTERLSKRGIVIRPINLKNFKTEVAKVKEVYNSAWDKNLGFVPMTDAEFDYMAKDMKMVLDPDFCLVAEHDGKMVGFALALPDINQILIKIKKGRLFPTGLFKLLLNKKKINYLRVLTLGVIEPYRKMGIEACFYANIIEKAKEKNILGAEASWMLEHNDAINRGIENINGVKYKTYRIFEKAL